MIQRGILTTIVFLSSVCVLFSQSADQIASTKQNKTHLERFSTPQMIARKNEIEANESLQKNPNDAAALNKRGVAGIQLKKFNAAADDLKKAISINPENAEF